MSQDKAQFAVNCSIGKDCNAVLAHLVASLRARRETTMKVKVVELTNLQELSQECHRLYKPEGDVHPVAASLMYHGLQS